MFSNPKNAICGLKGKKMNSLPNKLSTKWTNILLPGELVYSKSVKNRPNNCTFRPPKLSANTHSTI